MDVLDAEFTIKITKKDAEALAMATQSELIKYKNKKEKLGRLIELNEKFSELAGIEPTHI